ncbi:MAG: tetratricopeptide repeat protein [Gammaproteobacteria bacterium]|nr:tetratricopeptide repeat protein [Gammaproteobacteria bacterium]
MSFVAELRRRNVFRVAAAYLVVGWLLTEVLTTILPTLGAPAWTARAVILIFAFGFIPAVILSWFYELTPEGIKRDHGVETDIGAGGKTSKKLDHVAIATAAILIILVGLFSARQTSDDMVPADTPVSAASVAVLPFVNMSNDKDNEYFSDGLTETLLHMLAQIPDLKVAARTSSFAFKGKNISIQEIARALDVAHVLEGSVQRAGDRVRITSQLIRASDGFHVWSENYDRNLDDIFAIQDEIAEKVGHALSESLLGGAGDSRMDSLATTNPDAYDLYMQARKERATYSYGGLQAAEDLLKGALLIDPDFVDAKTELAMSYFHQVETGLMSEHEAYTQVIAITDQVLAARPDDVVAKAAAMFANASLRMAEGDTSVVPVLVRELQQIVAVAPDKIQPRILLVRAHRGLQQDSEAVQVLEDALKRDPYNPSLHYELGTTYMRLQRWDDARASLEKSLEIEPAQPNAYTNLGTVSLQSGDGVGFVTRFLNAVNVDPKDHELPGILAGFLYRLGLVEEADDFRDRVLSLAPTSEVAYRIELQRAISIGDEIASTASARRAIEDDVENRRHAYASAVQYLLRSAARSGSVEEEIAWINEQAPGIFNIEAAIVPMKYRLAQGIALDAWYTSLPRDEVLRRLNALLKVGKLLGFDFTRDPKTHVNVLAIRGETEEAIDVALEKIFSQPVAANMGWQDDFAQAQFASVVADPRVQAAMQHWKNEEEVLRQQIQAYFAELHTAE